MMYYKVLVCLAIFIVIVKCQRSRCPDTSLCFCEGSVLECNCSGNNSLVLRSFSKFAHKIVVEECENVEVLLGAFLHMEINYIEFKNINKLIVRAFAFSGIKRIRRFQMKNIADLEINLFGLSGLNRVDKASFVNVTALNLSEFAIAGSNVTLLEIDNSNFILESFSFLFSDMNDVLIRNTTFQSANNASLIIRGADRIDIRDSAFVSPYEKSLVVLWTGLMEISNCSFQTLPSGFLYGHVDHFFFNGNFIENSETNAFLSFYVRRTAEFKNNRFQTAEPDSLFPNPGNNVSETIDSLSIKGNELYCDCRLSWLLNDRETYAPIIQYSKCYNHKDMTLPQLFAIFLSNHTCIFPGYESMRLEDDYQLFAQDQNSRASCLFTETFGLKFILIVMIIARKEFSWNIL
ncbi:uncharacterized protein TNCT_651081 [Trichonephila clavata]|uniref:Uncharacterized protein n=1 Tax=Trichonephila clavata TaxID=2740835 RepID=A0A8X6L6A2_TRICU|nr:uncharacterized protein TNCT_651081 [Trichonephila clavata]